MLPHAVSRNEILQKGVILFRCFASYVIIRNSIAIYRPLLRKSFFDCVNLPDHRFSKTSMQCTSYLGKRYELFEYCRLRIIHNESHQFTDWDVAGQKYLFHATGRRYT